PTVGCTSIVVTTGSGALWRSGTTTAPATTRSATKSAPRPTTSGTRLARCGGRFSSLARGLSPRVRPGLPPLSSHPRSRSTIWLAGQRLHHDLVEPRGDRGVHGGRVLDVHVLDPLQRADLRVGLERAPPRQHLPEDDAEREDVRAAVELEALRLLRRHVLELAL